MKPAINNIAKFRGRSTKPGLNMRQWRFAEFVLQGMTTPQAYIKAGYSSKSMSAVRSSAAELLNNPFVAAYISKAKKDLAKTFQLDRGMILDRMMKIGMGKVKEDVIVTIGLGDGVTTAKVMKKAACPRDQQKALEYLHTFLKSEQPNEVPMVKPHGQPSVDNAVINGIKAIGIEGFDDLDDKEVIYEDDEAEDDE